MLCRTILTAPSVLLCIDIQTQSMDHAQLQATISRWHELEMVVFFITASLGFQSMQSQLLSWLGARALILDLISKIWESSVAASALARYMRAYPVATELYLSSNFRTSIVSAIPGYLALKASRGSFQGRARVSSCALWWAS